MKKEIRTAVYYDRLRLEAYRFQGVLQAFPSHFHEHYVIGLMEAGGRLLSCRNQEYDIQGGAVLLFNPGDSHACVQRDSGALDYRGLNLSKAVMLDLAEEVTGRRELPGFSPSVIYDREAACYLRLLHRQVMDGTEEFSQEENLLLLLTLLIQRYGKPFACCLPECREEVERACFFMERHFSERVTLEQLCRCAGLSRSALLRAFSRAKGVTPYRYLENLRVSKARKLLEEGVSPAEAALRTGFSDQSHFTNYFGRFIGLAPGVYRDIFREKEDK